MVLDMDIIPSKDKIIFIYLFFVFVFVLCLILLYQCSCHFVNPFFKKNHSTNPQSLLFQGFADIKKNCSTSHLSNEQVFVTCSNVRNGTNIIYKKNFNVRIIIINRESLSCHVNSCKLRICRTLS